MFNGIEKKIFSDVYTFMVEEYCGDKRSEEYWKHVMWRAKELEAKYQGNKLAKDMLIAVVTHLKSMQ